MTWPIIFLLVVLKLPIIYLGCVVWWAIRAEPKPLEGAPLPAVLPDIDPRPPWHRRLRPRRPRPRPHGSPVRSYARGRAGAAARAEADR
jgi:hypothetical protein